MTPSRPGRIRSPGVLSPPARRQRQFGLDV